MNPLGSLRSRSGEVADAPQGGCSRAALLRLSLQCQTDFRYLSATYDVEFAC